MSLHAPEVVLESYRPVVVSSSTYGHLRRALKGLKRAQEVAGPGSTTRTFTARHAMNEEEGETRRNFEREASHDYVDVTTLLRVTDRVRSPSRTSLRRPLAFSTLQWTPSHGVDVF